MLQAMVPVTDPKYDTIHAVDQVLPPIVTRNETRNKSQRDSTPSAHSAASIHDSDYVTLASRQISRRQSMHKLIDRLGNTLDESGARIGGFCPTRRKIFSDLFDEILRQVVLCFMLSCYKLYSRKLSLKYHRSQLQKMTFLCLE